MTFILSIAIFCSPSIIIYHNINKFLNYIKIVFICFFKFNLSFSTLLITTLPIIKNIYSIVYPSEANTFNAHSKFSSFTRI